jgi:CopZ-like zinc binding protein
MIIDCCTKEEPAVDSNCKTATVNQVVPERCRACGEQGAPVSRKTVLLMLKPELLEQVLTGRYRFCSTRDCPTVYFEEHGARVFTIDDLRVIFGFKANSDPIPLCYCFGFDESHLREEISQTGSTAIPDRISSLIRAGLCACEARNPSGVCCLGEVNRTAKRLKQELPVSD